MLIFVTAETFFGDLWGQQWNSGEVGRGRGDVLCNCIARRDQRAGTYKAWLSDGHESASKVLGPYFEQEPAHFVREDGACIAGSWTELVSGELQNAVGRGDAQEVWTGTLFDGSAVQGRHCEQWTSLVALGAYGVAQSVDGRWSSRWTIDELAFCGLLDNGCFDLSGINARHLYCVQVDDSEDVPEPGECPKGLAPKEAP